jgi:hypothetical protein
MPKVKQQANRCICLHYHSHLHWGFNQRANVSEDKRCRRCSRVG